MLLSAAAGRHGGRICVSKAVHLTGAALALATLLLPAAARAERSHDPFGSAAASATTVRVIVAQTSHASPGVPGSMDSGGSSGGSHAPPLVPGSSDSGGGSSGGSHPPPPVPGSTNAGGESGGSHAPPPVPDAAASSGGNPPASNAAGPSHAAPQVPLMGGNP
jgi:hypothetical protein